MLVMSYYRPQRGDERAEERDDDDAEVDYRHHAGMSLFGSPVTIHGSSVLSANVNDATKFDGEGNSAQSNSLTGLSPRPWRRYCRTATST